MRRDPDVLLRVEEDLPAQSHVPLQRPVEAPEHREGERLAGPRGAEEHEDPLVEHEIDVERESRTRSALLQVEASLDRGRRTILIGHRGSQRPDASLIRVARSTTTTDSDVRIPT